MFDATFTLNRDGIQYNATNRDMVGRDNLGKYVGLQAGLDGDDEVLEGGTQLANEDSIFAQFAANTLHTTDVDDEGDDDFGDDSLIGNWDRAYAAHPWFTREEIEQAYSLGFDPHRGDYYLSREELTEAWVEHTYRQSYPHLWKDEVEVEPATPTQSACQHDDYIKVLGWSAEKCDRGWNQSHGSRGRSSYTWKQAGRKQRHGNRKSFRDAELQEVDLYTGEDFLTDHVQLDDEETMITITNPSEFEVLDWDYQCGKFGYFLPDQTYYNPEEDEDPEPVPYLNLSYRWMSGYDYWDEYDDGYYDYDDEEYSYPSGDEVEDYEFSEAWMAAAWNDIDETWLEEERDANVDAVTFTQHGGPRGWKASKVAHLRLAEYA